MSDWLAIAAREWLLGDDPYAPLVTIIIDEGPTQMQGNLFEKLNEYSPPPRARNTARAPQRALPVEPEILPPERPKVLTNPVAGLADYPLFTDDDVAQAVKIYDLALDRHGRHAAAREVMMFALRVAAINLDVHP